MAGDNERKLDAFWMPFTANRWFRETPRLITEARGVRYRDESGRELLDFASGLWCVNAGHCHPRIVSAIQQQAAKLDYAMSFQLGHPEVFRLAERLGDMAPAGLDRVFFCNSGSESVDTALKIALAWHRLRGHAGRTRLIGRVRGYHGVGFGGISVGGIGNNRRQFPVQLPGTDHLPHTHALSQMAFSRGQPEWGAHLADALDDLVALHGPDTIAAVIVEPVAGSAGVLVPPVGYLERLRERCTAHGILLIFDEVITGFGRMGANTGAEVFGVVPDMLNFAKQITNGAIPMGGVAVGSDIYDTFMKEGGPEYMVEFPHGYTYSAHPVACAAALACLDILEQECLADRVRDMSPNFEQALHSLRGAPYVSDIRNCGFAGALQIESYPGEPARRPFEIAMKCWDMGFYVRSGGDTIQLGPPFISTAEEIERLVNAVGDAIHELL